MIKLTTSVIAMTLAAANIAAAQTSPAPAVKKIAIPLAAQSNAHAVVGVAKPQNSQNALTSQNAVTSPVKTISMRGHTVAQRVMVAPAVGIKPDTQPK